MKSKKRGYDFMNNKNYKSMILLLMLSCLYLYDCSGQLPINNQQQPVSTSQPTESININADKIHAETVEKQVESDLLKSVHKLVIDAKRAGILDEETAKILITYSILNNVSTQEAQKFLIAAELAGLSNQTRSIDLNSSVTASKNGSSGERIAWVCCCSILVIVIGFLIYERARYGTLDGLKHDLGDAKNRISRVVGSFFSGESRPQK